MRAIKLVPIIEALKRGERFAVIAHIAPDGDTIGSCLALANFLMDHGKTAELYCHDVPPENLAFLQGIQGFIRPGNNGEGLAHSARYDAVVCLDCSDRERLGDAAHLLERTSCTINVDHHGTNTMYGDINWVEPKASSTAELVFYLIREMDGDYFSMSVFEAIYTGIATDTGGFGFSNTTPAAHRIAAQAIEYGLDVDRLTRALFRNATLARVRLLAKALGSLEMHCDDRVAFLTVSQDMLKEVGLDENSADGIVNYGIDIVGVECAALFKETGQGKTKVSLRTKSKVDASALAAKFGGGGHARAAGCSVNAGIEKAKVAILEELKPIML